MSERFISEIETSRLQKRVQRRQCIRRERREVLKDREAQDEGREAALTYQLVVRNLRSWRGQRRRLRDLQVHRAPSPRHGAFKNL